MQGFNSNFSEYYINACNPNIKYNSLFDFVNSANSLSLSPFIASVFTRYGNRPPYPFTILENCIQQNCFLPTFATDDSIVCASSLTQYDSFSISKYLDLLRKAIQTDRKNKVVFLSSGWDSTAILALLVEKYGPENIICLTLRMSYDQNSPQVFSNPYEIKKAKQFCDYYKVKHQFVNSDHTSFVVNQNERIDELAINSLYSNTAYNHKTLWNAVHDLGLDSSDTAVYAGEFSDGAHNWGFSQSFSAVHPEVGLRQYADKVRAYFMSPVYLRRVYERDQSLLDDKLTSWLLPGKVHFPDASLTEKQFIAEYLTDLYFNDIRGPYLADDNLNIPTSILNESRDVFKQSVVIPNSCSSLEHIYSSYIALYHHCHWMGSTVHGLRKFAPTNYELIMPFGNKDLLQLLSHMPMEFGRGLELRPTKYPLKQILRDSVDYPLDLQNGQHAYIYDDDQSINLADSLMTSGTYFFDALYQTYISNKNPVLSQSLPFISDAVDNYISNPLPNYKKLATWNITAYLLVNHQLNLLSIC